MCSNMVLLSIPSSKFSDFVTVFGSCHHRWFFRPGLRQCGLKGDVVTYGALCNRNEWQQSLQILEEATCEFHDGDRMVM